MSVPQQPARPAPPPGSHPPQDGAGMAAGVLERLRACHYDALREVTCECRDGVLVLRGRVPTYYLKQVAQAEAGAVAGVGRVDNRIEVVAPGAGAR